MRESEEPASPKSMKRTPASGGGAADREQPKAPGAFECQGTSAPIGGRGNAQLRVCALERQHWDWRTLRPALFRNGGKQ